MASCWAKGCLYSALKGSNYCAQHKDQDKKDAAAAAPKIPAAVPVDDDREFEIVKVETIPTFKIQNEDTYRIALAVKTLVPGHALKVKVDSKKKGAALAVSVVNYCKKMDLAAKYRTSADCVWIWKPEDKDKKGTSK